MSEPVTTTPGDLRRFATDCFEAVGASGEHAAAIADVLVWASQRGVDSHGAARIAPYVELLQKGVANPTPTITVDRTRGSAAVLHADRAPGPVALAQAADLAVSISKESGVGAVGVQLTVHTGAIGYYTSRMADAGSVGIGFVAGMPNMAYTGAKGKAVATSPLSVAVPSATHGTVLLDMATATIALGKIRQHKASGKELPEGAAATTDGVPTTDPQLAEMPLPLGGAKGSGMSFAFELLTSVLVGQPIVAPFHADPDGGRKHRQNALLIALDPVSFGDPAEFGANVDASIDALKSLPVLDGADGVYFPGERSASTARQRGEAGIPLNAKVQSAFAGLVDELGVTPVSAV